MKKRILYTLLFPLAAYIILLTQSDYLYAVEENNLFVGSHAFMTEMLDWQGDLWAWIGCFLTQFFYYPWLGALILVSLWTATYFVIADLFTLRGNHRLLAWIPVCALLVSVTDIGYWMYYIKMPGYWFSQTVAFLAIVLLACLFTRSLVWLLKRTSSYVYKGRFIVPCGMAILAYLLVRPQFPEFQRNSYENHLLQLPFIVAYASLLLLPFFSFIHIPFKNRWRTEIFTAAGLMAFFFCAYFFSFRDSNFHAELRMARAVDECRWDDVIDEVKSAEQPTNLMVLYKNIALMHQGRLTDMFRINNCGVRPHTGDSLQVYIAHMDASMVYYQFGQVNYAYRWAMENTVEYGCKVKYLKMFVRCAIMNHEFELAAKYLAILKSSLFHKDWAKEREPMLRLADSLRQSEEYKNIMPLVMDDVNRLDIDNSLPEKWLLEHFSGIMNPTNDKLEEVVMCMSLWTENAESFCLQFYDYSRRHQGEKMAELYQQGALLYGKQKDSLINVDNFPFDDLVVQRYENFNRDYNDLLQNGMDAKDAGNRLKSAYGDTYWWYYYFYNEFNVY